MTSFSTRLIILPYRCVYVMLPTRQVPKGPRKPKPFGIKCKALAPWTPAYFPGLNFRLLPASSLSTLTIPDVEISAPDIENCS